MRQTLFQVLIASIVLCVTALCGARTLNFKRSPPAEAPPVQHAGVEYRVNHRLLGCVEAWDPTAKQPSWFRQIFVIQFNPSLERDVQDVFITKLRVDEKLNSLEITNESGGVFTLDLKTLEVKTVKGESLIKRL